MPPRKPAPKDWYALIQKAYAKGVLTFQEVAWLIKTRGSKDNEKK